MQTPKSSPRTTGVTDSHYTPASLTIPSLCPPIQNINTTMSGKNIGKCTSIIRAVFALVSFFFRFLMNPLLPLLNYKLPPPPQQVKFLLRNVHLASDKDGWGIPESMGPCPPTAYPDGQPNIINLCYKREENIRKVLDPLFHAIHDFISPLLNDQSMIQHPGDTGTDSNLISNDDFDAPVLPGLETGPEV